MWNFLCDVIASMIFAAFKRYDTILVILNSVPLI